MKINIQLFSSIFVMSLFCSGCLVAKSKYIKKWRRRKSDQTIVRPH